MYSQELSREPELHSIPSSATIGEEDGTRAREWIRERRVEEEGRRNRNNEGGLCDCRSGECGVQRSSSRGLSPFRKRQQGPLGSPPVAPGPRADPRSSLPNAFLPAAAIVGMGRGQQRGDLVQRVGRKWKWEDSGGVAGKQRRQGWEKEGRECGWWEKGGVGEGRGGKSVSKLPLPRKRGEERGDTNRVEGPRERESGTRVSGESDGRHHLPSPSLVVAFPSSLLRER